MESAGRKGRQAPHCSCRHMHPHMWESFPALRSTSPQPGPGIQCAPLNCYPCLLSLLLCTHPPGSPHRNAPSGHSACPRASQPQSALAASLASSCLSSPHQATARSCLQENSAFSCCKHCFKKLQNKCVSSPKPQIFVIWPFSGRKEVDLWAPTPFLPSIPTEPEWSSHIHQTFPCCSPASCNTWLSRSWPHCPVFQALHGVSPVIGKLQIDAIIKS